ncbi:MAG: hypothetical protein ACM3X1_09230, partial [Ignavibacteriales bacterium]
ILELVNLLSQSDYSPKSWSDSAISIARTLLPYFKSARRPRMLSSVSISLIKMSDSRRLFDSSNIEFSSSTLD